LNTLGGIQFKKEMDWIGNWIPLGVFNSEKRMNRIKNWISLGVFNSEKKMDQIGNCVGNENILLIFGQFQLQARKNTKLVNIWRWDAHPIFKQKKYRIGKFLKGPKNELSSILE